ncbi:MAG: N-formylglutamate amidohydrolase [Dongiaceae bacterium]
MPSAPGATDRADEIDESLLGPADPPPFEIVNPDGAARVVLLADHAGRAIPQSLGTLGLGPAELARHIAWDIGIADVTRRLARRLDAPAILAGYSRLVIDCNRRLGDPTSMPQESDGVAVPGNRNLTAADRARRAAALFTPYHNAVARVIEGRRRAGLVPAVVSMHSFTPVMNGFERPWHIGILWNRDPRLPVPVMKRLAAEGGICVGDNQPYSGQDEHGYSIYVHGHDIGLAHVLIEVRQDLIDTHHGAEVWAARLGAVLADVLADETLYRVERY